MIRHVAVFTWNEGTTEAQVGALCQALAGLPGQIADIRSFAFGSDAGLGGNADFAVVADFDDDAGYRAYASHPSHQTLIAELIVPIRATRHSVQFSGG